MSSNNNPSEQTRKIDEIISMIDDAKKAKAILTTSINDIVDVNGPIITLTVKVMEPVLYSYRKTKEPIV